MRPARSSSAGFLARAQRPRANSRGKALWTAVCKGSAARLAGAAADANPYFSPDFHAAWREGWTFKDRELRP